jgi:hypothetical protein
MFRTRSGLSFRIDNLDRHQYDSPHVDDDLRVFIRSERDRCAAANQFRLAREYRISACSEPDEFCRLVRRKDLFQNVVESFFRIVSGFHAIERKVVCGIFHPAKPKGDWRCRTRSTHSANGDARAVCQLDFQAAFFAKREHDVA